MILCFLAILSELSPMSARNFPPSFWDSNYVPPTPPAITHPQMSDLYSTDSSLYSTEPWIHNAAHYGTYAAAQAHVYHQNMASMAQYGSQLGLLRLPQQYGGHSSRWVRSFGFNSAFHDLIFFFSSILQRAYLDYIMNQQLMHWKVHIQTTRCLVSVTVFAVVENSIKAARDALMSRLTCSLKSNAINTPN